MNLHAALPISPRQIIHSIIVNRSLLFSLVKRDVFRRYRGTTMGCNSRSLIWDVTLQSTLQGCEGETVAEAEGFA
jgi:hypothetical protein